MSCHSRPGHRMSARQQGKSSGWRRRKVSTLLLPENVHVGDYLIVHAGFALRVLEPREAEESLKLFRQIAEQDGLSVNF